MLSLKLISGIVYPYIIIFLIAGFFLTFYFKFLSIRFPFLSLKIVSGTLDWKGSKGKITPGRSFFSGALGSFFPGILIGLWLALLISGPGIIICLIVFHFLQMSMEYVLSTVSFKFRIRNSNGTLETGLILGIEKYSRIRWFGYIYGIFFVILTFLMGFWNLSFVHSINNIQSFKSTMILDASSIMLLMLIFMILVFNGGIRRIGLFSKIGAYFFSAILILLIFSLKKSIEFLPIIFREFTLLFTVQNIKNTLFALVIYSIFAEVPSLRLNIFSGYVRTDHAAKQGIATLLYPIIQILIVFLLSGYIYEFNQTNKIELSNIHQILNILYQIHTNYIKEFIFDRNLNIFIKLFIYISLLFLLFNSFLTWFYSGNMIFRQLAKRFGISNIYPAISIFLYLYVIFFHTFDSNEINKIFYNIFISITGIVLILTIMFSLIYYNLGKYELLKYSESYEGGIDFSRDIFVILFSILPSNFLSKVFGMISLIRFPQPIMYWIILGFSKLYNINLEEVKKDLKSFKNLNEFFIRELKDNARTIDKRKEIIISPVDATMSRKGSVHEGLMIQAKGIFYNLKDLLGDPEYLHYFENGKYCVLYLSPKDYHRIHTPYDCEIEGYTYSPGHLFPVNEPAVEGLYGLFPKNERLTTFLKTKYGRIAMVKVGATNVGKIRVMYDSIQTNTWIRRKKAKQFKHKILFKKGQEIARFEMGSTVILLFEKNKVEFLDTVLEGVKVKLGQPIARFSYINKK